MYCGFIRIEKSIACKQLNAKCLHFGEKRGKLMQALNEIRTGTILNAETGGIITREEAGAEIAYLREEIPKGQAKLAETQADSLKYYKLRNRLFLFGSVGVFAAKVASPYIS